MQSNFGNPLPPVYRQCEIIDGVLPPLLVICGKPILELR
jgi:hypothetical protein